MINCKQCYHYVVCMHSEDATELKKSFDETMTLLGQKNFIKEGSPLSVGVTCSHEKHSDDIMGV